MNQSMIEQTAASLSDIREDLQKVQAEHSQQEAQLNRNLLDSYSFDHSSNEDKRNSMSYIGFNSMNAASNRTNPMKGLSRMIDGINTTPHR